MDSKNTTRYRWYGKTVSVMLSAALIATSFTGLGSISGSAEAVTGSSSVDYGLMDTCQEGTILHCFDWKYTDIIEELPNIAAAGFTSVQTSPAQPGGGPSTETGTWWWLYQPLDFAIGTNYLGTKDELQELCTEAEEYGIKIIVDVVANHLAGDHTNIAEDLKPDKYWRTSEDFSNKTNRYITTHKDLGMPDIVSEDSYVQQRVAAYIQELKSVGVDGIRWDTLKHIQVPSEDCAFFSTVIDPDMYNYGESLGDPGGNDETHNRNLMKEYTGLMSVTDDVYGNNLRKSFKSGSVPSTVGNWSYRGSSADRLVYWGESHDTYSNLPSEQGENYSATLDQNIIDRAYAIVASRKDATALYFSRPFAVNKDDIHAGVKGSTHFTSAEVAAVNHFHNAMYGQSEYCLNENGCSAVCREQGAVIVAASGSNKTVSISNGGGLLNPGTYTDEITGNTFTVTSSTITGKVGSTGIAAIYEDAVFNGSIFAEKETNTAFVDTMEVKLRAINVSNAAYTTSEGASGSFINGQTITIGSSINVGQYVTVTLTGEKSDGTTLTATYKYRKKSADESVIAYFDNSRYGWSSVYAYVYRSDDDKMSVWPGTQMTLDSSTGYYAIDVTEFADGKIIFSQNGNSTNRYPGENEPGIDIDGQSKVFGANHSWEIYAPVQQGSVSASVDDGTVFTDTLSVTLYSQNVDSASYTIDGVETSYTNGDTITLSDTTTVILKGVQSDGTTVTATYTYTKQEETDTVKVYFDNSSYNWSSVYAYVYHETYDSSTGETNLVKRQAAWPGTKLTQVDGNGMYELDVDGYENVGRVIFNDGTGSNTNRYPYDNDKGMKIGNSSMYFTNAHGWDYYNPNIYTISDTGNIFTDKAFVTLHAKNGMSDLTYTTSDGQSGSFTDGAGITIGEYAQAGDSVTITLAGIDPENNTIEAVYTYNKSMKVYFDKTGTGWSKVYAYIYDSNGSNNDDWPGKLVDYNSSLGLYEYDVTGDFANYGNVIFSNGQIGVQADNFSLNGKPIKVSKNGSNWTSEEYPKDISEGVIELSSNELAYSGSDQTVTATVTVDGETLTEGTDYTIEGDMTAKDAGTYIVNVIGINGFNGTLKATWKIIQNYTVTVHNGNGDTVTTDLTNGQAFSVTADKVSGKKFSYWKSGENKVSTSSKYSFIVLNDTELTAVYDEEVEVEPILNMSAVKSVYNGKNAVKFVFTHSVPSGYTVKEVGIRYGTNKLAGADTTINGYAFADLVDEGDTYGVSDVESVVKNKSFKIKQYVADYLNKNGTVQFSYAIGASTDAYVYAVGYMKLVKDGVEQTVYSNFIHTSYNAIG